MKSPSLRRRLAALPVLLPQGRFDQATPCKICGHVCPPFDVVDFNKFCAVGGFYGFGLADIAVTYHRCPWCRFLFTRFFDDWSPADFRRHIYNDDYIRVDGAYASSRPLKDAASVATLLEGLPKDLRILDYGSGSGLFAQALHRLGYPNVTSYDPFAQPEPPQGDFDLVTLFEVIEHVPDSAGVLADVRRLLRPGAAILFSSGFQPPEITTLRGNWWYVAPRNGHCSIFSTEAMAMLAERLGLALRGDTGLCALQSWPPSEVTAHITHAMKPPLFVRHLAPPPREDGDGAGERPRLWYRTEESPAGAFRWTASARVAWPLAALPQAPARLRALLPIVQACTPDYPRGCTLTLAGARRPTSVNDGAIQAECVTGTALLEAVLEGPALPPAKAGDSRTLGLAVMMA